MYFVILKKYTLLDMNIILIAILVQSMNCLFTLLLCLLLMLLQGVLPKLIAHTFLVFLLLIQGQLVLTLVNLPMSIWLFYEYFSVPSGNMGVYDPTEIHNRSQLKKYIRDVMIHLGYCLVFFFIYLYW